MLPEIDMFSTEFPSQNVCFRDLALTSALGASLASFRPPTWPPPWLLGALLWYLGAGLGLSRGPLGASAGPLGLIQNFKAEMEMSHGLLYNNGKSGGGLRAWGGGW